MIVGDADIWSDTFPEDLVPRILDLVAETWVSFEKPGPADHEVPTSRRFKHALKQAKDFNRLPFRIEREPAEDDPVTGEELGRIDIKLLPASSAREEVYFAFECKRLNAVESGARRSLAPEYVTEGMMRFVTGQYAAAMQHGGMIGYVLDGRSDDAIRLVGDNVSRRATELCMTLPASLEASALCRSLGTARQTQHKPPARTITIHHLFLECPASASPQRRSTSSRTPK